MTLIARVLPTPLLSLMLLTIWLLLQNTLSAGHLLLGGLLALILPLLTRRFHAPAPVIIQNYGLLIRFAGRVLVDILLASLEVAALILRPHLNLRPAFVEVPLDITGDLAVTLLASTVSLTPGTVSADISADRKTLLVHALDVQDSKALITSIKRDYEAPLKEIFGC